MLFKKLTILLLPVALFGCGVMDAVGLISTAVMPSSPGIDVSAQIGDDASKNVVLGEQSKKETNGLFAGSSELDRNTLDNPAYFEILSDANASVEVRNFMVSTQHHI